MDYSGPYRLANVEYGTSVRVTFADGTSALIAKDASIAASITNPEYYDNDLMVAFTGRGAARRIAHVVTVWTEQDAADLKDLGTYMSSNAEIRRWKALIAKRAASKRIEG
jgi:hypothetical protein